MKSSTKDQIKGKVREAVGHAKKHAGKAMDRPDIEDKGREEQVRGKVQKKVGEVKKFSAIERWLLGRLSED